MSHWIRDLAQEHRGMRRANTLDVMAGRRRRLEVVMRTLAVMWIPRNPGCVELALE